MRTNINMNMRMVTRTNTARMVTRMDLVTRMGIRMRRTRMKSVC